MELNTIRTEIDKLDQKIVALIAQRQHWVVAAGRTKLDGEAVRAPRRVEEVIAKVRLLAETVGAAPNVVEHTYRAMINSFIDLELSVQSETSRRVDSPSRMGHHSTETASS